MTTVRLATALLMVTTVVGCQQAETVTTESDVASGFDIGWERALEAVEDCAADSEPDQFAQCIAASGPSADAGVE